VTGRAKKRERGKRGVSAVGWERGLLKGPRSKGAEGQVQTALAQKKIVLGEGDSGGLIRGPGTLTSDHPKESRKRKRLKEETRPMVRGGPPGKSRQTPSNEKKSKRRTTRGPVKGDPFRLTTGRGGQETLPGPAQSFKLVPRKLKGRSKSRIKNCHSRQVDAITSWFHMYAEAQ